MSEPPNGDPRALNRLLALLPEEEYNRLREHGEMVAFDVKMVVYENNGPLPYIYFPISGVFSMVTEL
ncbi:MAG: hypothetical protein ACTHMP_14005, partial [Thermomicrobiales bacterium]